MIGVWTTGAQALQLYGNLDEGIVVCGYKLADMLYTEFERYLPNEFEMLLIASPEKCSEHDSRVWSGCLCRLRYMI